MRRFAGVAAAATCAFLVAAQPANATYRGKNGLIAISIDHGSGPQLYTIRPDGTDLTRLTSVDVSALDPDWSPDGMKIVFDVDPTGEGFPCRTEMMNADGSNVVDLTPNVVVANDGCIYNPQFTPNGKRIVFIEQRCKDELKCHRTIRSMNLQGKMRRRILRKWTVLPPGGYDLHSPRVSPDGRTVLFTVVDETGIVVNGVKGNRKALYSVRMNGGHLQQVVPFRFDVCVCTGDWAPNGRRIVSSDQVGPTPVPGEPSNLFSVRPDGTGLRWLTHHRTSLPDATVGVGTYSPDGRWIVFKYSNFVTGKYVLWKIHPDGTGQTRIRAFKVTFTGRDWGPRAS